MKNNILLLTLLLALAGCNKVPDNQVDYPAEIASLKSQLADAKAVIAERDRQIQNLQGISGNVVDQITKVNKIQFGRYSRLVDSNGDQLADQLVVYLQLYDASGDLVKVAGTAAVELWDLNAGADNRIGHWELDAGQLEQYWDGGLLADHYRMELPLGEIKPAGDKLTLKCVYTEALTGVSREAQKVIDKL